MPGPSEQVSVFFYFPLTYLLFSFNLPFLFRSFPPCHTIRTKKYNPTTLQRPCYVPRSRDTELRENETDLLACAASSLLLGASPYRTWVQNHSLLEAGVSRSMRTFSGSFEHGLLNLNLVRLLVLECHLLPRRRARRTRTPAAPATPSRKSCTAHASTFPWPWPGRARARHYGGTHRPPSTSQAHCRVVGIIVGILAGADLSSSQLTDPCTNWYKSTSVTPGSLVGLCMPSSLLLATHCGSRVDYSPAKSWLQHARMSTLSNAQPSTSCISFIMKLLSPPLAWRVRILSAVSAFLLRTSPLGSRAAQVPPLLGDAVNPQYVQRAAGLHLRVPTHGAHPRS